MSVYITVAMKSSHEIRALVMIGFDFFLFFLRKKWKKRQIISQRIFNPNAVGSGKSLSSHTWEIKIWMLSPQTGAG